MDTLDGVGHGTALAGRYRLEERLQHSAGSAFWRAVDQTLDRPIGIRVLDGSTAEETLDAARRAAMVEDPRLLRVLDVGTQDRAGGGRLTYVVSEFVDAPSLSDLLSGGGPMPADQVRALVGEAARGLEHARDSGLHHRRLSPSRLLRTPDGGVKVAGLAVDAAAEGLDEVGSAEAAREDAVALVALLYAGLTGRWPFGASDSLLGAPEVNGRAAPPADVVGGVPNDLDTLCAVTFGPHDDGPHTPGELADQLAPWGPRKAAGAAAAGAAAAAPSGPTDDRAGQDTTAMRPAGRFPTRMTTAGGAAAAGAAAAAARASSTPTPPADTTPQPAVAPAVQKPAAQSPAAQTPAQSAADEYPAGWTPAFGSGSGPAPGTPDEADEVDEDTRRDQSKIVIAVVAVLVVIGLVLAVNSLANIGEGGPVAAPTDSEPEAPSESEAPTEEEPAESPAGETPAAAAPSVVGVRTVDPSGDGENDETAPRAIDADPESFWRSSTYSNAEFGNLKDGLGLVVALNDAGTVSGVTIAVNGSGGEVELRSAPTQGFEGSTVVATSTGSGSIAFDVPEPFETQYVLLWWTELPSVDGEFRIELSQVQVQ